MLDLGAKQPCVHGMGTVHGAEQAWHVQGQGRGPRWWEPSEYRDNSERPSRNSPLLFPVSHIPGNHKPTVAAMKISTDLPCQNLNSVSLKKERKKEQGSFFRCPHQPPAARREPEDSNAAAARARPRTETVLAGHEQRPNGTKLWRGTEFVD
uniref:Uncharacterized protein n=1 Tax=Molossus molossus TaxID=27622 RepID=A0A7J8I8P6_MOLMO|nr:hypothetical protein HJG59_010544 [Molossus molossus]